MLENSTLFVNNLLPFGIKYRIYFLFYKLKWWQNQLSETAAVFYISVMVKGERSGLPWLSVLSCDLESSACHGRRSLCCRWTVFLFFFSLHVWPWLQTWIETFVFPVNTDFVCRVFCASRPTAHSLRCHSIDFYSQARNDFDAGTLFRVCLHYRSREAFGRSRLTCKNATNGAI